MGWSAEDTQRSDAKVMGERADRGTHCSRARSRAGSRAQVGGHNRKFGSRWQVGGQGGGCREQGRLQGGGPTEGRAPPGKCCRGLWQTVRVLADGGSREASSVVLRGGGDKREDTHERMRRLST